MTGSKRLLIVTSNEDLIRQINLNQYNDTLIIDLDDEKHQILNENNLLINLTQLNSSNDHLYKRTFDEQQSKSNKILKKSDEYLCQICNDHAIGYNYNVLSCAPCKIFFRRNANQNLETMRCLTGEHKCSVDYQTRRKCTRCRLEKCFLVGMKKELILTERKKQQTNHFNESQLNISNEIDRNSCLDNLSIEDWLIIERVQCSFVRLFESGTHQCSHVDITDQSTALISWSHLVQQVSLRFINYFRQIDQFEQLEIDDRLLLIKNNIFPISLLSKCFYYKTTNDCCSDDDNEYSRRQRQFLMLCSGTHETRQLFVQMILSLVKITKQDPIILSLLPIILIFSRGLSMSENESLLKNSLDVYRAQTFYLKVLWNYLLNQLGEIENQKYFSNLITIILQIQSSTYKMREYFARQYIHSDMIDTIAPIMQSVLYFS